MKLIPNAAKVAKRASSMWILYGGIGLQAADLIMPELKNFLPPYVGLAVMVAAAIARLVKQETVSHGK